MEFFEELDGYFDPVPLTLPDSKDDGSVMQTNMVTATTPGGPELPRDSSSYFLYSLSTDHSLTLPYTSSSTRAGYDNFTNTGYTQWNEANWNDTSQQAPQLASFGDAEYFAHTSTPILEQWHPDQGEHPIFTPWPKPSPYLHPARDSFANAITLQTTPDIHGSEGMTRYPLPLPADPDSAPPSELENNSSVMIGSIYATSSPDVYVFKCHDAKCASLTLGRWYDFRRHYNGAHAAAPTVYWCDFEGCPRSRGVGDRPFTRKDKVKDHFESMHKEEVEAGE